MQDLHFTAVGKQMCIMKKIFSYSGIESWDRNDVILEEIYDSLGHNCAQFVSAKYRKRPYIIPCKYHRP